MRNERGKCSNRNSKKFFYDSSGYRQPCPVAHEYKKILAYDDYENFHRVLTLIIAKNIVVGFCLMGICQGMMMMVMVMMMMMMMMMKEQVLEKRAVHSAHL